MKSKRSDQTPAGPAPSGSAASNPETPGPAASNSAPSGSATSNICLPGSTRAVRPGARALGVADPDEWIEVTLKTRRKKALPDVTDLSGPHLSRVELADEYGADPADLEKVRTVLTTRGLQILKEDAAS